MKAGPHRIIIKVPANRWEDAVTINGKEILIDASWKPTEDVKICAEVAAAALRAKHPDLDFGTRGINQLRKVSIKPEVKAGDLAYFDYKSLLDVDRFFYLDGELHSWVDYYDVFCVKRGDELIMIGSHILVEPYTEDSKYGQLLDPFAKESETIGTLAAIGSPLNGLDKIPAVKGDKLLFPSHCAFKNKIEGKEYYIMKQHQVLVIIANWFWEASESYEEIYVNK